MMYGCFLVAFLGTFQAVGAQPGGCDSMSPSDCPACNSVSPSALDCCSRSPKEMRMTAFSTSQSGSGAMTCDICTAQCYNITAFQTMMQAASQLASQFGSGGPPQGQQMQMDQTMLDTLCNQCTGTGTEASAASPGGTGLVAAMTSGLIVTVILVLQG
mmetsp:Transcript_110374/g.235732  ORF Transcript_110374/g.235732 Transcript_110374/m.235732 type:complete len:158 (+) Transcript_110374:54-527(+)